MKSAQLAPPVLLVSKALLVHRVYKVFRGCKVKSVLLAPLVCKARLDHKVFKACRVKSAQQAPPVHKAK